MLGTVLWITALAGVGGTGAGGILTCGFRRDAERTISLLLSFAAGVMLAVVCGDLLADALSQRSGAFGLGLTAGGVLSGYGLVGLLNRVAAQDQPEQSQGLFWAGVVMAAAIALHNLPDQDFAQSQKPDFAHFCKVLLFHLGGFLLNAQSHWLG